MRELGKVHMEICCRVKSTRCLPACRVLNYQWRWKWTLMCCWLQSQPVASWPDCTVSSFPEGSCEYYLIPLYVLLSVCTHLIQLSVCFSFDEVYYGQFVSLYMKRVFFIDESGPPLGHMILALGGKNRPLSNIRCPAHFTLILFSTNAPDLTNQLINQDH